MSDFEQQNLEGATVERFSMCARCGRALRAPQSVMAGYGHSCAEKVFFAHAREERLAEAEARDEERERRLLFRGP